MKDDLKDIAARVKHLEDIILEKRQRPSKVVVSSMFSGPKGGVAFLLSKGFFGKKRTAIEVKEKLAENNYHYVIQVVQTTLNRLSSVSGPLVAFKESTRKYYVIRK